MHATRRDFLRHAGLGLLGALAFPRLGKTAPAGFQPLEKSKPNIVIILADDLGYGDVQCYNPQRGKILTPHMDRLIAGGLRFTDGHSTCGVCSPSRYALLTGRYHWRTRLQAGIVGVFGAPLIAPDRLTIAGLAKQQGYRTACIGKWHLGWDWPIPKEKLSLFHPAKGQGDEGNVTAAQREAWQAVFSQRIPGGPTTRGFDEYFGTDVPNWPPYCFIENDRTVGVPTELLPRALLENHQASLRGPMLKGWQLAEILPALGTRAADFIARQTQARQPFLLYLPLTAPHTPLAVTDEWKNKSGLLPYADFVMETDAVIGRVLDALEKSGAAQDTLILFSSDNGCAPYIGAKELEAQGHFPSGPLRGYKGSAWEGGHRVAFAARWPRVIQPGSRCDQTVCQVDYLATLADILGVKMQENVGEDSVSLLPLLRGGNSLAHEAVVHHSMGGRFAIRAGQWKLLLCSGSGGNFSKEQDAAGAPPVQLYDLEADLGETTNLQDKHPEIVERLTKLLKKYVADGRSTPGAPQSNDVPIDIWKTGGKNPARPAARKKKAATTP